VIAVGALAVFLAAVAFGDATYAALISGLFTFINTGLLLLLRRDHHEMRTALTADRRIIYDADGRPIGTVLDLRTGDSWDAWREQVSRRHDDPPPPEMDHSG
jgi:hypothetical protein